MHPEALADDSLRLRYRGATATPVVRRPIVIASHRPASARPIRPAPTAVVAAPGPAAMARLVPAEPASLLNMSLTDVAAAPQKRSKYLVKPRRGAQYLLFAMGLSVFAVGGYVSFSGFRANHNIAQTVTSLSRQAAAGDSGAVVPSTTKPTAQAVASYTVAPDLPRYLQIGSLGTKARVVSVGQMSNGAVATPHNVYDAAWFNGSAKPGTEGAAFIDGHVSSWTTNGVFYNLKTIQPGAIVQIERGDGTQLQYRVVKTQVYAADKVDMNAAVNPVTPGKEGLNIMTCTGKVIKGTSEFDSRLLVFTERVS